MVDWHLIEDERSAAAFAQKLIRSTYLHRCVDIDQRGDQLRVAAIREDWVFRCSPGDRSFRGWPEQRRRNDADSPGPSRGGGNHGEWLTDHE